MAKQVIDFHASAGMSTNQSNEHQRRWSDRSWNVAVKGATMTAPGRISILRWPEEV